MFDKYSWLNEPANWSVEDDVLSLKTDKATDFWRTTHYGFVRDSGHFFGVKTAGGFTAQVKVSGYFHELYDQAGLMVRIDEQRWVKISAEVNDGELFLSTVVTDTVSDWSTGLFTGSAEGFWLRVTVEAGVLKVQASTDGQYWPLIRLAPFPVSDHYWVGPMACTPERAGLEVKFSELSVTEPNGKSLHDLS
jgi:regulation of enolase protein 1 (concanavalin A-like superfamily)